MKPLPHAARMRGDQLGSEARAARRGRRRTRRSRAVRPRRQELVEQMAVAGGDLDAAEAAALQARAECANSLDQARDLVAASSARGTVQLMSSGSADSADGIGGAARRVTAAARGPDLPEQAAVLRFDRVGPALQAVEVVVVPDADARRARLVRRHAERLGHDHRRAAPRAVGVIVDQPLGDARAVAGMRRHRRVHDAVAQPLARQ